MRSSAGSLAYEVKDGREMICILLRAYLFLGPDLFLDRIYLFVEAV